MSGRTERVRSRELSEERIGDSIASAPSRSTYEGRYVRLEPLDPERHAAELYAASHGDGAAGHIWRYMPYGPFADVAAFHTWLEDRSLSVDPLFFAVHDRRTKTAAGMVSFLNIHPEHASVEIGHIWFGPDLQKTREATEALFLLMKHALDDRGYRRLEWKCNALNADSRRAANRLGFAFEGIFYQHMIVKLQNRDTAWYSILDYEWPAIRANFTTWLAPENFDADGRQITSLGGPQAPSDVMIERGNS